MGLGQSEGRVSTTAVLTPGVTFFSESSFILPERLLFLLLLSKAMVLLFLSTNQNLREEREEICGNKKQDVTISKYQHLMPWNPSTYLREEAEKTLGRLLWLIWGFQEVDWQVVMKDPNWAQWPGKWEPNAANHGESAGITGSSRVFSFVRVVRDCCQIRTHSLRINYDSELIPTLNGHLQ